MASTASSIAGFACCLGIVWGLLLYGNLPQDVASDDFVTTLSSSQLSWVAKIWFIIHYILLDTQPILLDTQPSLTPVQLVVLTLLPWFVCGVVVGILSRNASRGFATGFLAVIVSIIVGWTIVVLSPFFGIGLPPPSPQNDPVQYLLTIFSFQAMGFGAVSGAGGALGGALTRKRE